MEKITFNKYKRPKSARTQYFLSTEPNKRHICINKTSSHFPNIKDKIEKKYFSNTKLKTKSKFFPSYYHKTSFFMSSAPFVFKRNKKNKNEFYIQYNGGFSKKFYLPLKKLNLDMSKINNLSNDDKYRIKRNKCLTENNIEAKKKEFNYIYNHLEEQENNNNIDINNDNVNENDQDLKNSDIFQNPNKKIYNLKNTDVNLKEKNEEAKEENKNNNNKKSHSFFKFNNKLKYRFHKIQIHNNCKPFLVDDYRYYAEKFLKI